MPATAAQSTGISGLSALGLWTNCPCNHLFASSRGSNDQDIGRERSYGQDFVMSLAQAETPIISGTWATGVRREIVSVCMAYYAP